MKKINNSIQFIGIFLSVTVVLSVVFGGMGILWYRMFLRKDNPVQLQQVVLHDDAVDTNSQILGEQYAPESFFLDKDPIWGENIFIFGDDLSYKVELNGELEIINPGGSNVFSFQCSMEDDAVVCPSVVIARYESIDIYNNAIKQYSGGITEVITEYEMRDWSVEVYQEYFGYNDSVKVPISMHVAEVIGQDMHEYFGCMDSVCIFFRSTEPSKIQSDLENINVYHSNQEDKIEFEGIARKDLKDIY